MDERADITTRAANDVGGLPGPPLDRAERPLLPWVDCTLCSCYPSPLLGLPPDSYKSRAYRARAVRDPRGLLRQSARAAPVMIRCSQQSGVVLEDEG